jgi:hypothetical protein
MRLILVPNPEVVARTGDYEPTVPLGVLSLATSLANITVVEVAVVDPRDIDFKPPTEQADILLQKHPDVIGFSTMCNT